MANRSNAASDLRGSWYDLLVCIGKGSTTSVHLARPCGSEAAAPVALKRLHPKLATDAAARRALLAEGVIGQRMHHPNVVGVHEVEDLDDELLLAMDYVEGASLAELLRAWPLLPSPVAVRILLDAAAGLGALHALHDDARRPLGVVHLDVSPHALLVGLDGTTRVGDLGGATCRTFRDHGPSDRQRRHPGYAAPEYLLGHPFDARADVFSLGVLAWELLAARPLFVAAGELATCQRVVCMEAPRISTVVPELGDAFDTVLERALAKDPAARFSSMDQLAAALRAASAWSGGVAAPYDVGTLVEDRVGDALACRRVDIEGALVPTSGIYVRS